MNLINVTTLFNVNNPFFASPHRTTTSPTRLFILNASLHDNLTRRSHYTISIIHCIPNNIMFHTILLPTQHAPPATITLWQANIFTPHNFTAPFRQTWTIENFIHTSIQKTHVPAHYKTVSSVTETVFVQRSSTKFVPGWSINLHSNENLAKFEVLGSGNV